MKENNKGVTSVITVSRRADDQQKARDKGRRRSIQLHRHWCIMEENADDLTNISPYRFFFHYLKSREHRERLFREQCPAIDRGLVFYLYTLDRGEGGQVKPLMAERVIMVSLSSSIVFYGRFSRVTSTVKPRRSHNAI